MIIHDVEQGSDEWLALRAGKPTASEFDKILTSTGKASASAKAYMHRLIAEIITGGRVSDFDGNAWTDRGHELEAQAVSAYEFIKGVETKEVGFVTDDYETYGCSPDRLIGDGLLEIKCPAAHTHIGYLLDGGLPTAYRVQVQGQLLVTGAMWCDFMSYHPDIEPLILRVERDVEFIDELDHEIFGFIGKMNEKLELLKERGIYEVS